MPKSQLNCERRTAINYKLFRDAVNVNYCQFPCNTFSMPFVETIEKVQREGKIE